MSPKKQIICSPSILAADLSKAQEEAQKVKKAGLPWIHFDVMDGVYVPNISFGPKFIQDVTTASGLKADIHLMVSDPEAVAEMFLPLRPEVLTFHIETVKSAVKFIEHIKKNRVGKAGITLTPETPVSALESVLPLVDLVLVMTVHPGFAGQSYIKGIESKVKEAFQIREKKGYSYLIEADGGIDRKTFPLVSEYVDVVVAGYAFFHNPDRAAFLRDMGYPRS